MKIFKHKPVRAVEVLLVLTFFPLVFGILSGEFPHGFHGNVWALEDQNVDKSFCMASPDDVFNEESLKPYANIKVVVYYRSGDEILSLESDVDEKGAFFLPIFIARSYIVVFKQDEKVLWRTPVIMPSHTKCRDFVIVRGEPIDSNDTHYLESNLPDTPYILLVLLTLFRDGFFMAYFSSSMVFIVVIWIIYAIRGAGDKRSKATEDIN